jgi:hypothetical protein
MRSNPARRYQHEHSPPHKHTLAIPERLHKNMERGMHLAQAQIQITAKAGAPSLQNLFEFAYTARTIKSFLGPLGAYYLSPTSTVLPGIPPEDNSVEFLEPSWASTNAVYAPFLPQDPDSFRTSDPVMRYFTLHMRANLLVEETENGLFRPLHADHMLELENDLVRLLDVLLPHLNTVLDIGLVHIVKPSDKTDYVRWDTTRDATLRRAYLAICGGLMLSSTISLVIATLWAVSQKHDRWLEILTTASTVQIGRAAFQPEFLDMIKSSSLNDFDVPRVGVFVDVRTCLPKYLEWIPGMILANVPVIFRWTANPSDFKSPPGLEWMQTLYGPNAELASTAGPTERTRPLLVPASVPDTHLLWRTPCPEGAPFRRVPPREKRSGETMFAYFRDCKLVQQYFLQYSTKVEREWCRWNTLLVMQPPYYCKWDDVAVWTQNTNTGKWTVIIVPKKENGAILNSYPAPMRRYDPTTGRWDVGKFWCPNFTQFKKESTFTVPWWGGVTAPPTMTRFQLDVNEEKHWLDERFASCEGLMWTLRNIENLRTAEDGMLGRNLTGDAVAAVSDSREHDVLTELLGVPLSTPTIATMELDEPTTCMEADDMLAISVVNKALQVLDPVDFVYTEATKILFSHFGYLEDLTVNDIKTILKMIPKSDIKSLDDVWKTLLGADLQRGAVAKLEDVKAAKVVAFAARLASFRAVVGNAQNEAQPKGKNARQTLQLASTLRPDNATAPRHTEWALAPENWAATAAQLPGLAFWRVDRATARSGDVTMESKMLRRYWQLTNKVEINADPILIPHAPFIFEVLRSGTLTTTKALVTQRVFSSGKCYMPVACNRIFGTSEAYRSEQLTRQKRDRQLTPTLGYRVKSHLFAVSEYMEYERIIRARLTQQHHLARACMQAGGILWRLAIEVICPDFVFCGPSDDALDLELGFRVEGANRAVLLDDNISVIKHDAVIGTYVHESNGRREAKPSWWPGDLQFKKSLLWTGSWTQSAEDWYQKQHQRYLTDDNGKASEQPKVGP